MTQVEEHDTATELESLNDLLDRDEARRVKEARRAPAGFDPACLFLLKLNYLCLFDPHGQDGIWFTCKGCSARVKSAQRQAHYAKHVRAVAKAGGRTYPDTGDKAGAEARRDKEDGNMATTTTRTRTGRSRNLGTGAMKKVAAAKKNGASAKTVSAKAGSATKTGAAKKTGATGKEARGKYVAAAVTYMKGKKPMPAPEIAKALCKTHPGWVPYNVAFAIYKAEREGKLFKRNGDTPALFSLKG